MERNRPTEKLGCIGILGGMSWPSTITYYRRLNELANQHLGDTHSARVLLWSENYHVIERMQLAGQWEYLGTLLADGASALESQGADCLGIACNTMHRVAPRILEQVRVPLIQINECVSKVVVDRGISNVAILGTTITHKSGLYSNVLKREGVRVHGIDTSTQLMIDEIIYSRLCKGISDAQSRGKLADIIEKLEQEGAEAVVLGCTELGLVVDEHEDASFVVIDATEIHVKELMYTSLSTGS